MNDNLSFIDDVLNKPEGKRMVEAIESTLVSLRGREQDEELNAVLNRQIDDLEKATGWRYLIYR